MGLTIAEINLRPGVLAIAPMPGRDGSYRSDLADLLAWAPDLLVSLTELEERSRHAPELPGDLARHGVLWRAFPIADYGFPTRDWSLLSAEIHSILARSGKVLLHCLGGCGRSGMIALRLMVEAGEAPEAALARLRDVRPCAVETAAQLAWAEKPRTFE